MKIEDAISYCPETGIFRWKVKSSGLVDAGDIAGFKTRQGYWEIGFKRKKYQAHRVAWYLMTGGWPNALIDHKNSDRSDNRWANLRQATHVQNSANRVGCGSSLKGVTRHRTGRYQAQIFVAGKNHYLGLFDCAADANAAYAAAAALHYGEFARAS